MEAWTGVLIGAYVVGRLAYDHFVARKAAKKMKAEVDKDIIDLRERINEIEDYPMFKMWKDQQHRQAS